MNSQDILTQIDNEYNNAYGPIRVPKRGGSNIYISILEHRRWMHPLYAEYLRLKEKEKKRGSV
jgi:hypothetical protein